MTPAVLARDDRAVLIGAALGCGAAAAEELHRRSNERRLPARGVIIRQGDRCDDAFLLLDGRAQALSYGLEGQLTLVQEYGPGNLFGALGPGDAAAFDVVALEPCRLVVLAGSDLADLMERHASLGAGVARALLGQLRAVTGRMLARTTLSATGRVHAELLKLAACGCDGRTVRPAPVLSKLAVCAQTTRETVSRTIHALERRGIVRLEPDVLVIVAPRRLEDMVV